MIDVGLGLAARIQTHMRSRRSTLFLAIVAIQQEYSLNSVDEADSTDVDGSLMPSNKSLNQELIVFRKTGDGRELRR